MSRFELSDRQTRIAGLALLVLSVLLNLRDPLLPQPGLDPSWQLAVEFAARHHLVFGRDYVFTYGPFHYLATRLFDPATFGLVLLYGAISTVAVFWVALRNRSLLAALGLTLAMVAMQTQNDALNALTFYGVFLICLRERSPWGVLFAALSAPLVLAKLSFGLVALPLVLLADVHQVLRRRLPLFTLTLLAASILAYLAAGQPIAALGDFLANTLEIILGYGRAMQITGPKSELLATGVLILLLGAYVCVDRLRAWRAGERDWSRLAAGLGFLWTLFVAFKMGFVRQDGHTLIFHQMIPAMIAMLYAAWRAPPAGPADDLAQDDRAPPQSRPLLIALFALSLVGLFGWRELVLREDPAAPRPPLQVAEALRDIGPRLEQGLGWVTWQRAAQTTQARAGAEASLRRTFDEVHGAVDAVPWEVAELIASGLDYRPRPVSQSYSAYTPKLQDLDRAFFAGPRAPDTLFLDISDIDLRFPTQAIGPSLPVIGQRYDAVSANALGMVLRKRATPRPMSLRALPEQPLPLNQWVPVPSTTGHLTLAHIHMAASLPGKVLSFAYRDPLVRIRVRTQAGRQYDFRLIPGMAERGFAISPIPTNWPQGAPMLLDPQWSQMADPVVALQVGTNHSDWAFSRPRVSFDDVAFAPGFAANLRDVSFLATRLIASDARHMAALTGAEIFAHADTTLQAAVYQPTHLKGVAGLKPQPPNTPPGDGVRFQVVVSDHGVARTAFDHVQMPGEAPTPFDVQASPGAVITLRTTMRQNPNYDWSYWGQLAVAP